MKARTDGATDTRGSRTRTRDRQTLFAAVTNLLILIKVGDTRSGGNVGGGVLGWEGVVRVSVRGK